MGVGTLGIKIPELCEVFLAMQEQAVNLRVRINLLSSFRLRDNQYPGSMLPLLLLRL
jgi:hypothetical protein